MRSLHNLTLRTASAAARFAELQRRAERITSTPVSPVTRAALDELSTALEELKVANETLNTQLEDLTALRKETAGANAVLDEFANSVPMAVLWTDCDGVIDKGNDTASALLNIGTHHLQGKPLMLFVTDRPALFAALRSLAEPPGTPSIDVDITVRPRERRPRKMTLRGRRLAHDARCVWFLQDVLPAPELHIA